MTWISRREWFSLVAAVTVDGMDNGSLTKLRSAVKQIVWPICRIAFAKKGFSDRGYGHFVRRLSNDISLSIDVEVESRQASVVVQTYLAIYHGPAMRVVADGLKSTQIDFDDAYASSPIDIQSLSVLLRRLGPMRSRHEVPMFDSGTAEQVADSIVEGVDLVADAYFPHGQSVDSLISYLETDSQAGGTANKIKLLSLCYVMGQLMKLRTLLEQISASNSAPMTVQFKVYIEQLLERRNLPSEN